MFGLGVPFTFLIIAVAALVSGIKILREYERGVVFRLGRMVGARGPGMIYVIPGIEKMVKLDLRGDHGYPAAGRDHPRQRLGQSQRRALF